MKTLAALLALLTCILCLAQEEPVTANLRGRTIKIGRPVTYRNLTVFPIEATGKIDTRIRYLTLEQAKEKKLLIVEKVAKDAPGDTVSITSKAKMPVYLMAGDILVNGHQSRYLSNGDRCWTIVPYPDYRVARDTVVPPGAEKLPVSVYHTRYGELRELYPAVDAAKDRQQRIEIARCMKIICNGLQKNRRCLGAVYMLNGQIVAADIWDNRMLWRQQMAKVVQPITLDAVGSFDEWKEESPQNAATAQDAAALLGQYELSEREVVCTADGLTNATVNSPGFLGFATDIDSSFAHGIIYTRRISTMLRPGVPLPSWRVYIAFIPLQGVPPDAPPELASRIMQETQILCAQNDRMNVTELRSNSPIIKRMQDMLKGDETALKQFFENYRLVADASTEDKMRRQAAGHLAKALGLDAVVYGAIDIYEFTTKPDRNRTYIRINMEEVMLDGDGAIVYHPFVVLGTSWTRPDGGGAQAMHDQEAILAVVQNLAIQMSYPWY